MRAISLVKKIEFEFAGNVVRNALTLGDVDNDELNELIIGNDLGTVVIFKGNEVLQTIPNLSFISCVAVGKITNQERNSLIIITSDGWCYLYETEVTSKSVNNKDEVDGQTQSSSSVPTTETQSSSESTTGDHKLKNKSSKNLLVQVHVQRIPANVKNIVLGDVDGDGEVEMVIGLTDRVVRSYRWVSNAPIDGDQCQLSHKPSGKFVALHKWECAKQIGSITLHYSADGKPSILVAQPGGTFMRIKCHSCNIDQSPENSSSGENPCGSVDYQFLGISRMRNQNISTEILGDLKTSDDQENSNKSRPYAVATLDGTIMLVQDEVILWAIAVDHQIFALTKLDITGNGTDDIVVCSWDGQTYILDQKKNSVRFHLEEPVRAFHSGWYSLGPGISQVTALIYVTFKNTVIIYYDIPLKDLICKKFEPDLVKLSQLFINEDRDADQALQYVKAMDKKTKRELVEYLLYHVKS
ncbi:KICSTOR complex protein ITFG2-like [Cylas formicarius]|uniref:KICSTOR complex protein ITFG2-like n=1 Tax=Cylas formicarius TaxID=197179 RepID=UPI0029586A0D|nr:KICSTOR complex protein ITFG2-like [Cylas formicarius]